MEIELPKQKSKASTKNPGSLIIFSKPKVGKTELVANLENCLILDLEKGTNYVEAMKIEADSVEKIIEIGKAIKKANYPYKYVAIDTITALENICIPYAEKIYSKTPMGSKWFLKAADGQSYDPTSGKAKYGSILNLPQGSGYGYLRDAITKTLEYIKTWAPNVILLGHVKDAQLDKDDNEISSMEIDLTGKIKRIITSQSDAVGYMYRKGKKNYLSFKTSDEVSCGARPPHLSNAEFVISEKTDKGLITYWDKVYIN